jgi:wyosine [tRNA(Phe)-imidazoG37] synthetase (radical SAM superfamily)
MIENTKAEESDNIMAIAFGPVPSRRLGRSLGINNIPPKVCSYSCLYCQVGRTLKMEVLRRPLFGPEEILRAVEEKVARVLEAGKPIDYLTFVPDGEPTLDANLGLEIEMLKPLGIKIAIISNASLIWRPDVQEDLKGADFVSLKVDAVDESIWRRINRPQRALSLPKILEGMREFARSYKGELATETMLVGGINDLEEGVESVADFLAELRPSKAYLSIPTRPPAEDVRPPDAACLNSAFQIFGRRLDRVEYLVGYEGEDFTFLGDAEREILATTAVHPMSEEAVLRLLDQAGIGWSLVNRLIRQGKILEVKYEGRWFYLRRFKQSAF